MNRSLGATARRVMTMLAVAIGVTACFPSPPPDDEGHATFAREAIPTLLGRRAYGVDEVEAVADIAQLLGRNTAVQMLMKDPRFVDHWADTLIDMLKMQRDSQGGIAAQDESCWGPPTRANPDPAIATWVRDHGPTDAGAPTPAWNMSDLLRSAIAIDDLSVVYRANLFPLAMRLAGSGDRRNELTDQVLRTYTNRDVTCLRCHNPTFSTSNKTDGGGNIVWRRLWTIPGHAEKMLFGNYYDTTATLSRVRPIFRGDVRKPGAAAGIQPWGMAAACAKDTLTEASENNAATTHQGFKALVAADPGNAGAKFGSLDGAVNPRVSLWELEASLRTGINNLEDGYERFPATNPVLSPTEQRFCNVVEIFSGDCVGCHSGPGASANMDLSVNDLPSVLVNVNAQSAGKTKVKRVVSGNPGQSELSARINSGDAAYNMPPGAGVLSNTDQDAIDDWITNGPFDMQADDCSTSDIPDVDPDEALAFLTAAHIVDGIWTATMGYPLTIDHGFPRNAEQRDLLWNLTEYEFVPKSWSLKAVLTKILSSKWYARRAPTISQGSTAYELPPVLDPWVVADPSQVSNPPPHERANGQGELVNRYRVNTVLRTIAATLAWKEPRRFPDNTYPSPLDMDFGQYLSPGVPGFNGINFQSLLALEVQAGLCNKSGRSLAADDWIDQLVSAIEAFNTANPDSMITFGEAWAILKDRLIQDPTIERDLPFGLSSVTGAKSEERALIDFLRAGLSGSIDLAATTDAVSSAQLESKLREACGILVKTPEFLLTNLTPRGYSDNNMPDPPRLNVCMDGEFCGYPQACSHWRGKLIGMGKVIACEDRSVRRSQLIVFPLPRDFIIVDLLNFRAERLCPVQFCKFTATSPTMDRCLLNPRSCERLPPLPPACDPRIDECGGPLPPDVFQPGMLVSYIEGAPVEQTTGVRIRSVGERDWRTLAARTVLKSGDVLHVPLNATLRIRQAGTTGDTIIAVDPLEQQTIEGVSAHLIAVTGPSAQKVLDTQAKRGALTSTQLRRGVESARYESAAPKPADIQRIIRYGAKPDSKLTPTPEEIARINADFNALHFPAESGLAPDGSDLPSAGPPGAGQGEQPLLWILIVLAIVVIVVAIIFVRRARA